MLKGFLIPSTVSLADMPCGVERMYSTLLLVKTTPFIHCEPLGPNGSKKILALGDFSFGSVISTFSGVPNL